MKAFLNWSGGKDSAFCLFKAKQQGLYIDALVTAVNEKHNRISMHGVRNELLEQQAASIQLPLHKIFLPEQASMECYEEKIGAANKLVNKEGFDTAVFGDIFLEDLKKYREELYSKDGIHCLFPIWKMNTTEAVKDFMASGFKAIIVCVNGSLLDKSFCGRMIDEDFLNDLPSSVDACGENGEYHSFVFDGPIFQQPIRFAIGEMVCKEYQSPTGNDCFTTAQPPVPFYFCDLLTL